MLVWAESSSFTMAGGSAEASSLHASSESYATVNIMDTRAVSRVDVGCS